MDTPSDLPVAYIVRRIHDFVRRAQPIMYAQAVGGSAYPHFVDAVLGPFWLRVSREGSDISIHTIVTNHNNGVTLLHVSDGIVVEMGRDIMKVALDELLLTQKLVPMLEQALVLDDLSSV